MELVGWHAYQDALEAHMRALTTNGRPLRVLEAGCGRKWEINLSDRPVELVGVDLDPQALQARTDLTRAIHGDLCDETLLAGETFDVVFSQFVLEHIPTARRAMEAMVRWTRPEGLLIVVVPDSRSVYGWLAAHTPHWVHVAVHRYLFGESEAGKPGHAPYPIHYSDLTTDTGIERFAMEQHLAIESSYAINELGSPRMRPLMGLVKRLVSGLSGGALASDHDNLAYVLRRS